jgi:hypothetical protein
MEIHSKKWKTLLKKTRITAEMFIDEIRGHLKLETDSFRFAFCLKVFPWEAKNKNLCRAFQKSVCGKVSSLLSQSVSFY